jgi:hypothetical protein
VAGVAHGLTTEAGVYTYELMPAARPLATSASNCRILSLAASKSAMTCPRRCLRKNSHVRIWLISDFFVTSRLAGIGNVGLGHIDG